MSTIHATTDDELDALRTALSAHDTPPLRIAILFGSLAERRERPDSDVAVAAEVLLDATQKRVLIERLAEVTGRPVDLVDLRTAGEPLLGGVLKGKPLLLRDRNLFVDLVKRHLIDVEDFLPLQRRLLEARRKAWMGG